MTYVTVLIPVYNEQSAIRKTITLVQQTLREVNKSSEIIVVNDGSSDATGTILSKIKGIKVITHDENRGYGASLKTGIKQASGEWILITDADGTYPVKDIPRLLQNADNYDMVVGARTGKNVNIPLLRRPAKAIIGMFANFLTGRKIPDINSGFRVFRKSLALEFFGLFPEGFSFTTTITMAALCNDYHVQYLPINYFKRKGTSTIHPIKDFIGFNVLMFKLATYFNPIKVFAPIGIFTFVIGLIIGLYVAIAYLQMAESAIFLMLFGMQFFFIGILADLIIKRRR